jgi:nicotinate dehydrogenase subunit B
MTEDLLKPAPRRAGQSDAGRRTISGQPDAPSIGDWLHIELDGTVLVYTGKVEVGQHIRTSLAQAVAEELRLPVAAIRLVMADTDCTPFDMGTFGSQTTPTMSRRLRQVAAATRELLRDLAAERLHVDRGELDVAGGWVIHRPTGGACGFGELTGGRRLNGAYRDDAPITPPDQWTVAGTGVSPVDGRAIVTGAHNYTPDLTVPGMLAGAILRPPRFGAALITFDTAAAEALPGVVVVHVGDFVGVTAPDRATALRARDAIRAEWTTPENLSSARLFDYLRSHPAQPEDPPRSAPPLYHEQGDVRAARAAADLTLTQSYTVAYIAHTPLEPRAALAEWSGDRLIVWTGSQRPFGVRGELAAAFQIPEETIRVIVPDTGSAYGGKHTGEAAVEAARLARAAGAPVKLIWTREEEFTWAYFRPAGVIEVASGARSDGTISAWEFHNYNSGAAGIHTPYDVPNQLIGFHPTLVPLRQGSYRALAATANNFARETHMDELARALGVDPLAFRLKHLQDERLRAVLEAAATGFSWGRSAREPGSGYGIAGGTEKGSYVATCAEVAVDRGSGQVRVARVVQAFECGAIVNPAGLRSQAEGAIVQGLGGALFEAIAFEDGQIRTNRFSLYRVPRFADMPAIEVILLDRKDLPSSGAGETPIIGIAPAVGNAIFDATGVRVRSLPLVPNGAPQAD